VSAVPELASRWVEAWNSHDVDAIADWYADDGTHRMASGNTYVGGGEIRAMVARSIGAYPDLAFDLRDTFVTDSNYAIEYTMRAGSAAIDGVLVGTTDGAGRVRTCVDYLDHLDLRRQLGLARDEG
jgi:uncharacterized protein (TIGR02246 family)